MMMWLAILSGIIVLGVIEGTSNEFNGTNESPVELSTTEAPPPREAVTDLFAAPLASFKPQVSLTTQLPEIEGGELVGLPLGKAENTTDSTPTPAFSNLWFNAGQSLGSAANSLTGWLNNRLVPQTSSTSTTTRPPEVIVRVQSHKGTKKPLISIDPDRKTQGNRISPVENDTEEEEDDDDEEADDEVEYDDGDEESADEEDSNSNRYSSNEDEEENDGDDTNNEDEDEDEEEEEVQTRPKKQKNNKKKQHRRQSTNNRRGYDYEEDDYSDEYYDDDDEDYGYDKPNTNSGRQQQQQGLFNRIRQLAQIPYSTNNKQQNSESQTNKLGYRPVRIVQNGQMIQLVQDHPSQQQIKRRRPSSNQNAFQLIPIRNNQTPNRGQTQKRKKLNKPDAANQIVIPIPQSLLSQNGQKRPSQYVTIPWSQIGINNPQKDYSQSSQQAPPIIVNIPQLALQQNSSNRRKRPPQKPTNVASAPQRKRLRRPIIDRSENTQVVSVLTDQNIRDIFRVPEIPPSRTPQKENLVAGKRKRPANETPSHDATSIRPSTESSLETEVEEEEEEEEAEENENQNEQEPFIMVGDENTDDEPLARHMTPKHFLHIGGMKGRFYLKSGRQMRIDFDERPGSKVTLINAESMILPDKSIKGPLDITTESSSETKANAPPSIFVAGSEDTSTTGNPLSQ